MITITGPKKIGLSKNPLPVKLQSNAYQASAGSAASAIVHFNAVDLGDSVNLTWAAGDVTFTIVSSPDDSGEQLPTGVLSAAYVTTLLPYFNRNYYLNRDYIISQVVDTDGVTLLPAVQLLAKATGINYNIVPVDSGNLTVTTTDGTDTVTKPGFGQLLEVWLSGSTDTKIWSETLNLDYPYTGLTSKDISNILHPALDYDIPDLSTVWQPCTKSWAAYYLKYAEVYGDTPKVRALQQTAIAYVYLGGYSQLALNAISDPDFFQKSLLPNPTLFKFQRWFETYPVDTFSVRTNMPALLYFINNRTVAETLNIRIDITFDTAVPQTIIRSGGLLQPFNKVCINCSYLALGLNTYTNINRAVTGYTVTLVEATTGDPRSLAKTFVVNRSYQQYVRYILYSDSAGNFKTLEFNGVSEPESDVSSAQTERFTDETTPFLGSIDRYNIQTVDTDAINTGYISSDKYDQVKELMMAKKAFRVFQDAIVPIVIKDDKFIPSKDGDYINATKIQYQLAYKETVYTASTGNLVVPELNKPQTPLNSI